MDRSLIQAALALPSQTHFSLTGLHVVAWGRDLHFECDATSSSDAAHTFQLQFIDCRDLRWQLYTHLSTTTDSFPKTDLANFTLGRSQHRSPAHLLTDHFGVSLYYGHCQIVTGDEVIVLGT